MKLVKNNGQSPRLAGKSKYLLYHYDKDLGEMYAKPGLMPIVGLILAKIKYGL